jgi:large subunit ribosomal protein L18
MALTKTERRTRIRKRIRKIVSGTAERPRLSIFRSNKEIYAQLIDDVNAQTLVSASSLEKDIAGADGNKSDKSALVGKSLAAKAKIKVLKHALLIVVVTCITVVLNHWQKVPEKVD